MNEHKVVLVPTLYVLEWILQQGVGGGITADNYRKAQAVAEQHRQSVLRAYRAGVKIAMGSDSIFPLDEVPREFASLVHAGLRPWDAIEAGTLNSAQLLGIEADAGSLEVGKRADLVAVPGDPLADITVLQRVTFVMSAGKIIRHDGGASR